MPNKNRTKLEVFKAFVCIMTPVVFYWLNHQAYLWEDQLLEYRRRSITPRGLLNSEKLKAFNKHLEDKYKEKQVMELEKLLAEKKSE